MSYGADEARIAQISNADRRPRCWPQRDPVARRAGAGGRDRTRDLPLTRRLLYQLSYAGCYHKCCPYAPIRISYDSISISWVHIAADFKPGALSVEPSGRCGPLGLSRSAGGLSKVLGRSWHRPPRPCQRGAAPMPLPCLQKQTAPAGKAGAARGNLRRPA